MIEQKQTVSKIEQRIQTRPKDAEVFAAAAAMLNMTATHDAKRFGVTRQTLSKWMQGVTSAPREAYIFLLDEVMKRAAEGKANYSAAELARIRAREQANLNAEDQKKASTAKEERIAAALKIIKKNQQKRGVDAQ